ncbi:MAG: NADPH:quinone oxidoreductase family protein [Deltaproteobacteria bacterium]|nr:NADPH:quinone oxidoreductase family protein [Deltaproteobacteria bacterium]
MKAMQLTAVGGPANLKLTEIPEPTLAENEVLIKVECAGVNFADVNACHGRYPLPPLPAVIGFEAAGTVTRLGAGVRSVRQGERVVAFVKGAYAEQAVASESLVYPLPPGFSWDDAAATLVVFQTAYHAMRTAGRLQTGETLLVHAAAGGVGTAALQLAKAWGVRALGTASSPAKLDLVRSLGAEAAINYATTDFVAAVRDTTKGRGADVVLESVGGEVFTKSLDALAPEGRIVVYGNSSGTPTALEPRKLQALNQSVAGFSVARMRAAQPERLQASYRELAKLFEAKQARPIIGRTFPLAEAGAALNYLASRQSTGKVLLKP